MHLNLAQGNAAKPGGDHAFADIRALGFDPYLWILAVPAKYTTGALWTNPCVLTPLRLELHNHVRIREAHCDVAPAGDVQEAFIEVVLLRRGFGIGQRRLRA